jgi:hypothetical protein
VRPPRPHDVIHRVGLALEHSTSAIASPSAVGGSPTHTTRSRGASAQETSRIGPLLSPKHNHTTKWCTTPASTFPLAIYERVVGDVGFTVAVALTRTRAGKTGGTCRFTHICPQPRVHHKNVHFINLFLAFETSPTVSHLHAADLHGSHTRTHHPGTFNPASLNDASHSQPVSFNACAPLCSCCLAHPSLALVARLHRTTSLFSHELAAHSSWCQTCAVDM